MSGHDHDDQGLAPAGAPTSDDDRRSTTSEGQKRVYLVATFQVEPDRDGEREGPTSGTAEQVVAVVGIEGRHQRFEWVGEDRADSVARPALVTPIVVRLGLPSPWHPAGSNTMTGLVQLAPSQLGDGSVDEDLAHLLGALAASRDRPDRPATDPLPRRHEVS